MVTKEETIIRWEYAYDLLNQLEAVKKDGEVVSAYTYDPNGFRVEKVGSTGKTHYIPHLNGEVGYRKEFSSNAEYSFIYVGGQHFARVDGVIGGNGKKYFYHNDHLGSALAVTDENGNKVVERDFTPFGERINVDMYDETNRDPAEDDSGFTGKDWDADVELYYFNARWYDAEIGRFITEDSVMDEPNLYSYGFNNPIFYLDPTGMFSIPVGLIDFADFLIKTVDSFIEMISPILDPLQKTIEAYDAAYKYVYSIIKVIDPDNENLEQFADFNSKLDPLRNGVRLWREFKDVNNSAKYLSSAGKMWNELGKLGYSELDKIRFLGTYYDEKLDDRLPHKSRDEIFAKIAESKTEGEKLVSEINEGLDFGPSAIIDFKKISQGLDIVSKHPVITGIGAIVYFTNRENIDVVIDDYKRYKK